MKHVVITGGTSGFGLGLARAFLELSCRVTLSGQSAHSVSEALAELGRGPGAAPEKNACVAGAVCDVTSSEQLTALWTTAAAGSPIDLWINNAGRNAAPRPFHELELATVRGIVDTNLSGVVVGSWVAARGMLAQGHGALYNLEGFGADGSRLPGLLPYATSKAGVRYFSRALAAELKATPVRVCTVDPGVVVTPMLQTVLTGRERFGLLARFIDGMAQPVDVVAPRLARQMLADPRSGSVLRPFGPLRTWARALLAPLRPRLAGQRAAARSRSGSLRRRRSGLARRASEGGQRRRRATRATGSAVAASSPPARSK